jgi:hypothetical protein
MVDKRWTMTSAHWMAASVGESTLLVASSRMSNRDSANVARAIQSSWR